MQCCLLPLPPPLSLFFLIFLSSRPRKIQEGRIKDARPRPLYLCPVMDEKYFLLAKMRGLVNISQEDRIEVGLLLLRYDERSKNSKSFGWFSYFSHFLIFLKIKYTIGQYSNLN